jgi:undecaprenyl diphosphate synthase
MPEGPLDPQAVLGLSPGQLPHHIAIIMDGNGRWAKQRGLPRIRGHQAGAESVRDIVSQCARLGISYLTLYSFSSENWNRPVEEVSALMDLYAYFLVRERETLMENDVRLVQLGQREGLPENVLKELDGTMSLTRDNTGLTLCLALNYGSRQEIVDAVRAIAEDVAAGNLRPQDVDEALISQSLYTAGTPDPDLLIRTAGEYRLSNFLLWQISYAEFHVSSVLWPDFRVEHLHAAIQDFARRDRRFGRVTSARP